MFLGTSEDDVYRNRFRVKRFARFLGIVDEIIAARGECRILDSGGRMEHWAAMAGLYGDRNIRVSLVNLEAEETTDPRFTSLAGNACDMPEFADNSFDLVYSNSVIEHVGRWSDQKRMAAEVRRLAPRHFIQTPDYWCPIEPHFRMPIIQWLPVPWQTTIVRARACGFYPRASNIDEALMILEDARLVNLRAMKALFPDSTIERERVLGLPKSLIAVR